MQRLPTNGLEILDGIGKFWMSSLPIMRSGNWTDMCSAILIVAMRRDEARIRQVRSQSPLLIILFMILQVQLKTRLGSVYGN